MLFNPLKSIFGSSNDRAIRSLNKTISKVNHFEEKYKNMPDLELSRQTIILKERLANGESIDDVLIEAFATVQEASSRVLKMRHFDVQLLGGLVLHQGKIAEMKTGEGKTLVATLAAYLNALPGEGVHIITVNDYLARRDAQWMAPLYNYLGLSVGIIQSYQGHDHPNSFVINADNAKIRECQRVEAYQADITYGTNNEFGFDYLRDNMALRIEDKVQRQLGFAIVDEVDSILIDEARTPLVISGATKNSSSIYKKMSKLVLDLDLALPSEDPEDSEDMQESKPLIGDFTLDEKSRSVELTEDGHQKIEDILFKAGLLEADQNLYQASNLGLLHHVNSALKAKYLFNRDVEYLIKDGQAILIDEHTGRTMPGRRLSDGLHQAIEAKENLSIQQESQTLASTTFQNYFRLYEKLAGMTGTADTEAYEFQEIYNLQVNVIPTNTEVVRKDEDDVIFLTQKEKFEAVIDDIKSTIHDGAPVLVGTASVETSELLSKMLKKAKVSHKVLNAKQHELEANIIVNAGRPGAVTIATNMAGRGTDIVLGGNLEAELNKSKNFKSDYIEKIKLDWKDRHDRVIEAGGLHIFATERHESRRIDNQLRGRAGRQGDPGVSRFYLSLEDPLMRLFASDTVKNMMRRMGMEYGESISHSMVTNSIVKAQRKVEGRNFDIRKHLLEYDDVANDQRQVIYQQRKDILEDEDISSIVSNIRDDVVNLCISRFVPVMSVDEQWDIKGLEEALTRDFGVNLAVSQWLESDNRLDEEGLRERIVSLVEDNYKIKCSQFGDQIKDVERQVMLQVVDTLWKDHLSAMEQLRQGIGLRAYAQKNPKQEYKRESFRLFEELLDNIKFETVRYLSHVKFASDEELKELERRQKMDLKDHDYNHAKAQSLDDNEEEITKSNISSKPLVREGPKVGRNELCPCGSGKKYKLCCGKI